MPTPMQPPLVTVALLVLFVHTPISWAPSVANCNPPDEVENDSYTKASAML